MYLSIYIHYIGKILNINNLLNRLQVCSNNQITKIKNLLNRLQVFSNNQITNIDHQR